LGGFARGGEICTKNICFSEIKSLKNPYFVFLVLGIGGILPFAVSAVMPSFSKIINYAFLAFMVIKKLL
jgi:hypothetical protein